MQYIAKEKSINKNTTRPNKPPTKLSGKFQGVSSHRARGERRGRAVDVGVVEVGVVGLDGGWGGGPGLTMHHFGLGVKYNFFITMMTLWKKVNRDLKDPPAARLRL